MFIQQTFIEFLLTMSDTTPSLLEYQITSDFLSVKLPSITFFFTLK